MLTKGIGLVFRAMRSTMTSLNNSFMFPSEFLNNYFRPSFVPSLAGIGPQYEQNSSNSDLVSLLSEYILKAVPKTKVSPSRKRMKHGRYIPDRVDWYVCKRCGEPRRPHRICTKHIDICALREDEYQTLKKSKESEGESPVDV